MAKRKGQDRMTVLVRTRLCGLRDAHKLSNTAWANAAKQDPKDVGRFVLGQMVFPPLDFLDSLSRVFQVTLAELLAADAPKVMPTNGEQAMLNALKGMSARDRQAFEHLISLLARPPRGGRKPRSGA